MSDKPPLTYEVLAGLDRPEAMRGLAAYIRNLPERSDPVENVLYLAIAMMLESLADLTTVQEPVLEDPV